MKTVKAKVKSTTIFAAVATVEMVKFSLRIYSR